MEDNITFGVCALTKTTGKYVKSHIIPAALTKLSRKGEKHVEAGIGLRVKHRATSWYDNALVTRVGEDILADIDAQAIEILRRNKLVWSGWGDDVELLSDNYLFGTGNFDCRGLRIEKAEALQLFFLSIVWRAAASNRLEFEKINLTANELEDIRLRVLSKDSGDFQDYPIQLFQITSIGIPHNRTPLLETKEIADSATMPKEIVDYIRIYFDGLVAHVHLPRGTCLSETYLRTCLRANDDTIVFLHKAEESRAQSDLKELMSGVLREQYTLKVPLKKLTAAISSAWARGSGDISE